MIVAWSNNISCTIFKLLSSSVLNSAHVDCWSGALLFMHSRMRFYKSFRRVHFYVYLHLVQVTKVEQLMNPARSRTRRFSFSVAKLNCYVIVLCNPFTQMICNLSAFFFYMVSVLPLVHLKSSWKFRSILCKDN